MKNILSILLLLFITGCVPILKNIELRNSITEDEVKFIFENGTNTVKGQAFLRQQGGGIVTCAGYEVSLTPVTDYSNERFNFIYGNTDKGYRPLITANYKLPENKIYNKYTLYSTCDAQGNFEFTNVPDGNYFLTTQVIWVVGHAKQGGYLMNKIILHGKEVKEIIMTNL